MLSPDHNTKWLNSFLVPSQGFRHILIHFPLRQGILSKMNELHAITVYGQFANDAQALVAPPKCQFVGKKIDPGIFRKKSPKQFVRREKIKKRNHPKRILPKFRAEPSFVRGVNGRSKFRKKNLNSRVDFRKCNVRYKDRALLMLRYVA